MCFRLKFNSHPATKRWSDSENAEWKEEKKALRGRIYENTRIPLFETGNTGGGLSGIWIINNHG